MNKRYLFFCPKCGDKKYLGVLIEEGEVSQCDNCKEVWQLEFVWKQSKPIDRILKRKRTHYAGKDS